MIRRTLTRKPGNFVATRPLSVQAAAHLQLHFTPIVRFGSSWDFVAVSLGDDGASALAKALEDNTNLVRLR